MEEVSQPLEEITILCTRICLVEVCHLRNEIFFPFGNHKSVGERGAKIFTSMPVSPNLSSYSSSVRHDKEVSCLIGSWEKSSSSEFHSLLPPSRISLALSGYSGLIIIQLSWNRSWATAQVLLATWPFWTNQMPASAQQPVCMCTRTSSFGFLLWKVKLPGM